MTETGLDLGAVSPEEIAARLRVDGLNLDRQAAVWILRDFGGGSILEWPAIRTHLTQDDEGWVYVRWRNLADAVEAEDQGLVYLSSSARGALELALALATGRPVADLGSVLCRLDWSNATVVRHALSFPLRRERDPLRAFAEWLVSLDDPEGNGAEARRTVTLNQIITRARQALAKE